MAETAKIRTLRNRDTGEAIAPRTVASAVAFEDGSTFQSKYDDGELTGPNTVGTSTATDINGLLKGNGSNVSQAAAGTDYAKAPTKPVAVTLRASGWTDSAQAVTVNGIVADETAQIVDVAPAMASVKAYMDAGVYVSAAAENRLTFTCGSTPSADLTVYVSIQNV